MKTMFVCTCQSFGFRYNKKSHRTLSYLSRHSGTRAFKFVPNFAKIDLLPIYITTISVQTKRNAVFRATRFACGVMSAKHRSVLLAVTTAVVWLIAV